MRHQRWLAFVLAFVMIFNMLPVQVFADDSVPTEPAAVSEEATEATEETTEEATETEGVNEAPAPAAPAETEAMEEVSEQPAVEAITETKVSAELQAMQKSTAYICMRN